MNRRRFAVFLLFSIFFIICTSAAAQSLQKDLTAFVETPAIPGYEQALANEIRSRLQNFSPQSDSLGNLYVTLKGSSDSGPHRLLVAAMDEPGYVVSGITDDGYLRLQRLPQTSPPLFDLLYAAQPVLLHTRKGKWVPGVVGGLSVHLQPNRQNPPRGAHPDEMYVDIGAASAAEVRQAGVDLLDPVAIERKLYPMGFGRMTAPAIGDRFGCAALTELLRHMDTGKLRGTLTIAFLAQQWADARGLYRLLQRVKADELIYIGRLLPRRPSAARGAAAARPGESSALNLQPKALPGSGVSIATADAEGNLAGLSQELKALADANKIQAAADFSAPLPRPRYAQEPPESLGVPQRFAHLGIPTRWPSTPGEIIDSHDLENLVELLELYAQGTATRPAMSIEGISAMRTAVVRPQTAPAPAEILKTLVETYGASGHEGAVREAVAGLLPAWAKPETDAAGNLVLRLGSAMKSSKAPRVAFVAHMDEIGYQVRSIADDGRLVVETLGGGRPEFFLGHSVLVHTATETRPGVLELPVGWDRPGFEWSAEEPATSRVDVGARSAGEVAQLGIKPGDGITVPKKYRRLFGTRANGRSFDDRVGCAALLAAVWALGPNLKDRDVTFIWSTQEEVGLRGAGAAAARLASENRTPDYVFAVDTFVSSDAPLESKRFADAPIGKGFVIRAVDNSNIAPRDAVDRLAGLARANNIPVQYGVTGGGNDGAMFVRYGSLDVPIAWPLRYSHSLGEVIDTRDLEALARIVAAIARNW